MFSKLKNPSPIILTSLTLLLVLSALSQGHAQIRKPCFRSAAFEADKDTGTVKVYKAGADPYGNTFERLMMVNPDLAGFKDFFISVRRR